MYVKVHNRHSCTFLNHPIEMHSLYNLPSMIWKNNFWSFLSIMEHALTIWKLQILFCKMLLHVLITFNHVFVNYFNGNFWHGGKCVMRFHCCLWSWRCSGFHVCDQRAVKLKGTRHVTRIISRLHGHTRKTFTFYFYFPSQRMTKITKIILMKITNG